MDSKIDGVQVKIVIDDDETQYIGNWMFTERALENEDTDLDRLEAIKNLIVKMLVTKNSLQTKL